MASNPWRVDRYATLSEFTDKLGRTFRADRAEHRHQAGKGYVARLFKRKVREAVDPFITYEAAAEVLGTSPHKLQRILETDV